MKRMHISVNVDDLQRAIAFYGALFDAQPDVVKEDYARFRLDDPSVNFSISAHGRKVGMDHMGIDVDSDRELTEAVARLRQAGHAASATADGVCCYAQSSKSWSVDPAGVPWEVFHTYGASAVYGTDRADQRAIAHSASQEGRQIGTSAREACCD